MRFQVLVVFVHFILHFKASGSRGPGRARCGRESPSQHIYLWKERFVHGPFLLHICGGALCKSLHPYGANLCTHTVANLCTHLCKSLATAHPYGRYASDGAPRAALGVEGLVRPPKICKDGCKDLQRWANIRTVCVQRFAKSAATDVRKNGPWTIFSFHR